MVLHMKISLVYCTDTTIAVCIVVVGVTNEIHKMCLRTVGLMSLGLSPK